VNVLVFLGLTFFYTLSCLYFHYRGFSVGFEMGRTMSANNVTQPPVQQGEDRV